jgi:hypothetical protein
MGTERQWRSKVRPSRNGKMRVIQSPGEGLLLKQKEMLDYLVRCDSLRVSDIAFSYRKGLSDPITRMFESVSPCWYAISFDIQSFFPSISSGDIYNLIYGAGHQQQIAKEVVALSCYRGNLSVGSALSPFLSNAYLFACDEEVENALLKLECHVARYADDYLITGMSELDCRRGLQAATEILYRYGFRVNPCKTRTQPDFMLGQPLRGIYDEF